MKRAVLSGVALALIALAAVSAATAGHVPSATSQVPNLGSADRTRK